MAGGSVRVVPASAGTACCKARGEYVASTTGLLRKGGRLLLVTLDYDQARAYPSSSFTPGLLRLRCLWVWVSAFGRSVLLLPLRSDGGAWRRRPLVPVEKESGIPSVALQREGRPARQARCVALADRARAGQAMATLAGFEERRLAMRTSRSSSAAIMGNAGRRVGGADWLEDGPAELGRTWLRGSSQRSLSAFGPLGGLLFLVRRSGQSPSQGLATQSLTGVKFSSSVEH